MTTPDTEPIHEGEPGPAGESEPREPNELADELEERADELEERGDELERATDELEAGDRAELERELDEPQDRAPTAAELKRFETENTRHEKALAKIIGRDWEHFEACSSCGGVGFAPSGASAEAELVEASGVVECGACNGWGRLVYPTRVEGQRLQVCIACAGNGWTREPEPAAPVAAEPVAGLEHAPAAPAVPNGPVAPPGYILVPVTPPPAVPAGYPS